MKMPEIRQKAKSMGLKADGSKADLIQRIQSAEGNDVCFGTRTSCPHKDCCWREDCLK